MNFWRNIAFNVTKLFAVVLRLFCHVLKIRVPVYRLSKYQLKLVLKDSKFGKMAFKYLMFFCDILFHENAADKNVFKIES